MSWKCSKVKVSLSTGEMLESTTRHGVTDTWDRPSKAARKVMENKKGQYYTTIENWEYFYVMYQVPEAKPKLKGARIDEYRDERKKYLAKKERDNSGFKGSRVKRSRAKEAMQRV